MSRNRSRRSNTRNRKGYGLFSFLFDFILGCLTGGLWWAFLLFRAVRGRN